MAISRVFGKSSVLAALAAAFPSWPLLPVRAPWHGSKGDGTRSNPYAPKRYSGAALRALRAVRGVGRPPSKLSFKVTSSVEPDATVGASRS